ncbi:hypothetical protein TrST_g56 [Triparma strigata]|uniref:tRNA-specific 2-thiouridylase MnmA-like C-terminal domain-containing protein n=1 Tax=Triparma strigata TaxID=1606541 RepID=A0A9W7ES44_9STRA|nr:hypothetical protein TrST_g56 [Triparma strigata]
MSSGVDSLFSTYLLYTRHPSTISSLSSSINEPIPPTRPLSIQPMYMLNWLSPSTGKFCPSNLRDLSVVKSQLSTLLTFPPPPNTTLHPVSLHSYASSYYTEVFMPTLESYESSITLNPDTSCNSLIKFDIAKEQSLKTSDLITTGHYATLKFGRLKIPRDVKKDQTYFMSTVDNFDRVFFPLESWLKNGRKGVRESLHDVGLGEYDKKDSMGMCMVPSGESFEDLVREYAEGGGDEEKGGGDIRLAETGERVGGWNSNSKNPVYYTVGQRVPVNGYPKKLFMLRREGNGDVVVVDDTTSDLLYSSELECGEFNWMGGEEGGWARGRIRHGQPLIECEYRKTEGGGVKVKWKKALRAVAKGQICCLYDDEGYVIGGGAITWTGGEIDGMAKAKSGDNDRSV